MHWRLQQKDEKKAYTVMINNSTSINKTISYLKQFNNIKITTYGFGNPDSSMGQTQKYGGNNHVIVFKYIRENNW